MTTPLFTVSVLAFGRIDCTVPCVQSVLASDGDFELILTDNNSPDGTLDFFNDVAKRCGRPTTVIHNDANLGYQIPHTEALNRARGRFFVILNNDTVLERDWLNKLVAPLAQDPNVAMTGPAGNCCHIRPNFDGNPSGPFEYLEGSCLMCRAAVVRRLGLFDPHLSFIYGEDSDLSLRVRQAGYKIVQVPMRVKHVGRATTKTMPSLREVSMKNQAWLVKRWAHYLNVRKMEYPIVITRTYAIGDVLLTTPIIAALKEREPTAKIVVRSKYPEIFESNPLVDQSLNVRDPFNVSGDMMRIDLDMAYENRPGMPIVDAYAEAAGVALRDRHRHLMFYAKDHDVRWAQQSISRGGAPWCAIAPGPTTWRGKNWMPDRWATIAAFVRSCGYRVMLIGAEAVIPMDSDLDLRGKVSISQSAAALQCCDVFIGVDSLPMHLAMSQGVRSIGLFGATDSRLIFVDQNLGVSVHGNPKDAPCIGARHRVSGSTHVDCDGACMRQITVKMVQEAFTKTVPIL